MSSPTGNSEIHFWQGNQACAEAAIAAGCRFFAGYPITPASEIAELMARKLPKVNGTYIQMEDEIGAIAAIIGASWGGMLSMTATSGPGFSLMQENLGYAIMTETPCVVVDVQRAGPSTGQATKAAQGDFMQSQWGTHGDHLSVVLAPYSAQETFEMTIQAFEIAERLRHPVILLSDEIVAHSREKVVVVPDKDYRVHRRFARVGERPYGEWDHDQAIMPRFGDGLRLLVTGSTHDSLGFRRTSDPSTHDHLVRRLHEKVLRNRHFFPKPVISGPTKATWGVISFGSTARAVEEAVSLCEGKVRSLRLRTLWPFPDSEVRAFAQSVEHILVPELNLGQLVLEVERAVGGIVDVVGLNKIGGGRLIEPSEILDVVC